MWFKSVALQEKFALLLLANLADLGIGLKITPVTWPQMVELASSAEATPYIASVATAVSTPDIDWMIGAE